jgi:endo-1,4-beta-xylanase
MAHNMAFRLHNLCWHNQNPQWLKPSLSAAELTTHLQDHIATAMGRYKGKVYAVDVVNEAWVDAPISSHHGMSLLGDSHRDPITPYH